MFSAVAQELKQQKAQWVKQREDYVKKAKVLRRELELLRTQKQELLAESSPERDTQHILRENSNLQVSVRSEQNEKWLGKKEEKHVHKFEADL